MIPSLPILLGLVALASARCGTPRPSDDIKALHETYQAKEASAASRPEERALLDNVIDTYVHIIVNGSTAEDGHVSQKIISDQIDVLNEAYSGTSFSFNLVSSVEVFNASWRRILPESPVEYEMKSTLRKGSYRDLNLYIDSIAIIDGDELLGYATFPVSPSQKEFALDGVVIDPRSLPGGTAPYDLGVTGVHEVGHWLSLFHTFESHGDKSALGGCYGKGDYIYDTAAEGTAAFGCMKGRDTCKGKVQNNNHNSRRGLDPIHNYMDYSDDSCLTRFSPGQIRRMKTSFLTTRVVPLPDLGGSDQAEESP